ncbi:regulator of chromosome condensation-like [Lineus longissimus]|uniref:regulator of chromosome condensation-like n=1 Tax=Lineus longissimus TaxID=88925 RepID=UPI002B4DF519
MSTQRATGGRGRKRKANAAEAPAKKQKQKNIEHVSHRRESGIVLTIGEGDVGQLGLGEDVLERTKPGKVNIPDAVVQVHAGGMHTVCLTVNGEVYTFGCNDEGALGRDTTEEGSETLPVKADLLEKVVQISAGDSHTAALTDDGRVFIWGTFRDANGVIGLLEERAVQKTPVQIFKDLVVVKIASGSDHIIALTTDGIIHTIGNSEQGQLGRLAECMCQRGGRKGVGVLINPDKNESEVRCKRVKGKKLKFVDVWAGAFVSVAKEESGDMYAWGLNNYYQLGAGDMVNRFVPQRMETFSKKQWKDIGIGMHHIIALDTEGKVHAIGRGEYGRLGLGEDCKEQKEPKHIGTMNGTKVSSIASGSCCSFAVSTDGTALSWGMGSCKQLASTDDDEDAWEPTLMKGKQLENRSVIMVSSGGQHTVLLAKDKA